MNKSLALLAIIALTLLTSGCAARPELLARDRSNPEGTDLSGLWVLRGDGHERDRRHLDREDGIYLPPATSSRRGQQAPPQTRSRGRAKGPSVHVFLEYGQSLKVTQTEHGLFVSFDRAVVEEYTFGENRTISLGPIEAQRVSGWEGPAFVVETMDDRGAVLTETWTLATDGQELVREIGIVDDDELLYTMRQVFERT